MTTATIHGRVGEQYKIASISAYVVSLARWCDCIFGPHWHEVGAYPTVAAAEASIKAETA